MTVSLERPVRLTELEAVNVILRAGGESGVSSLEDNTKVSVTRAVSCLAEQNLVVQQEGWNFAAERELVLTPDPEDGFVYLPEGILSMQPVAGSQWDEVVERDNRLYNPKTSTFDFSDQVEVRVLAVVALPFADLPMPARWYVTLKGAAAFVANENGGVTRDLQAAVLEAKGSLERYDRRLRKGGLRRHNPHFARLRGAR